MPALSRSEAVNHQRACDLVASTEDLDEEDKQFLLDHWLEASTNRNRLDGAFFTPLGLARDLSIEVNGDRIIDLGAGIGHLAWSCRDLLRGWNGQPPRELVCVEANPDFVRVGRKILPEATWICGDVFAAPAMNLGQFDCAIGNPPFTRITPSRPTTYTGIRGEYHFIALAAQLARNGTFIVPQRSAPFRYSGEPTFSEDRSLAYDQFVKDTGIELTHSCGIDTSFYAGEWRGTSPRVEIVTCDFSTAHRTT